MAISMHSKGNQHALKRQSACTQKAISMQSVWRAACNHEAVACRHRLHAACTHEAVAVGRRVERANVIRPVEHCVGAELARRRFPRHLGRLTDTSWRRRRRRDGTQAGREPSTDSLDDRDWPERAASRSERADAKWHWRAGLSAGRFLRTRACGLCGRVPRSCGERPAERFGHARRHAAGAAQLGVRRVRPAGMLTTGTWRSLCRRRAGLFHERQEPIF